MFNPNGAAATVTVGSGPTARTWSYAYTGVTALTITHQLTVTRPDGSTWQYSLPVLPASVLKSGAEIPAEPPCDPAPDDWDSFSEGTVISPAGATLILRLNRKRFARSYVYKECWNKNATDPDSGYLVYPNEWYAFAVIKRTISGPGLTTAVWNYAYSAPTSWYQDCPTPTSCASTVWTDVTDPDGNRRRSIFSNRFDETENKLLREEVYTPSSQLLRATDYAYATVAAGAANPYPWLVHVGNDMQTRVNTQTSPMGAGAAVGRDPAGAHVHEQRQQLRRLRPPDERDQEQRAVAATGTGGQGHASEGKPQARWARRWRWSCRCAPKRRPTAAPRPSPTRTTPPCGCWAR